MTDEQVRNIAKVEVREYFDYFFKEVYPKLVNEHFNSCEHGKFLTKVRWMFFGVIIVLAPSAGISIFEIIQKFVG